MEATLIGSHIAIVVADGIANAALNECKTVLEAEGAITKIISDRRGDVHTAEPESGNDVLTVDLTFDETDAGDYDALLLLGGESGISKIRDNPKMQEMLQSTNAEQKPIALFDHGAALLISAGLVNGRRLTSNAMLQTAVHDAGGNWTDELVVVDGNWISSRTSEDLPVFKQKLVEVLTKKRESDLQGTAKEGAVGIASS